MLTVLINIILLNHFLHSPDESNLIIHFENIRFVEGNILVGVYRDADSWSKRTPIREITVSKADIKDGQLTVSLPNFEPGIYGLAFLDDSNGNEIVDMGMIFPKEGFGFSNYYHDSFMPPRFKDFTFNFPQTSDVKVKFRYLSKSVFQDL